VLRLPKGSGIRRGEISAVHLLCIFSVQIRPFHHM